MAVFCCGAEQCARLMRGKHTKACETRCLSGCFSRWTSAGLESHQKLTKGSSNRIFASYLSNFHIIKSICNKKYQTLYWIYYETPHWACAKKKTHQKPIIKSSLWFVCVRVCMVHGIKLKTETLAMFSWKKPTIINITEW